MKLNLLLSPLFFTLTGDIQIRPNFDEDTVTTDEPETVVTEEDDAAPKTPTQDEAPVQDETLHPPGDDTGDA